MVKHYCDVCGCEVTRDNGIVNEQEFTIENGHQRIAVLVSVTNFNQTDRKEDPAALCAYCIAKRFVEWSDEVFPQPQSAASKTTPIVPLKSEQVSL